MKFSRFAVSAVSVGVLILLFTSPGQARTLDEAKGYLIEAVRWHTQGNYKYAKSVYRKAWAAGAWDTAYKKAIFNNMGALFMETGSVDEATRLLNLALEIDPVYRPALLNKGLILDQNVSAEKSRAYWYDLLSIDMNAVVEQRKPKKVAFCDTVNEPDIWESAREDREVRKALFNNIGVMYFKIGDTARAASFFEQALAIDPAYRPAMLNLGLVYERIRPQEESQAYWQKLFEVDERNLIEEGKLKEAWIIDTEASKDFWLRAAEEPEYKKTVLNNIGAMYLKLGESEKADSMFEQALSIDPGFVPAMMNRGLVYERERGDDEVRQYWMRVLGIDVDQMIEQKKPAAEIIVEAEMGDDIWAKAAEQVEHRKKILNNMAALYLKTGDLVKAEEFLQEALDIDPGYGPAALNLGLVYERNKSEEESRAYWQKVLEIDVDSIIKTVKPADVVIAETGEETLGWVEAIDDSTRRNELLNNIGALYLATGDLEKAREFFEEALRVDPEFMPARMNLGLVIERASGQETARDYWREVLDIDLDTLVTEKRPSDVEIAASVGEPLSWGRAADDTGYRKEVLNNLGALHISAGDIGQAEAVLQEALRIDPEFLPAMINLGLVYERSRGENEARQYWQKVLDLNVDSTIRDMKPAEAVLVDVVTAAGVPQSAW